MKHEHDGWLYYHTNGDLTFQTMESYKRTGWVDVSCRIERIRNDAEYLAALEEGKRENTSQAVYGVET